MDSNQSPPKTPWYYRPWIVILLLFFVLGPFGLPLVYKSPYFGRKAKIFLTLLTVAYTAYVVWATVKIVQVTISSLTSALQI